MSMRDLDEERDNIDIEEIFRRQDEAMALLERLRACEPTAGSPLPPPGGGRRHFRRWPMPPGVTIELHDGVAWHVVECTDMGVGGARVNGLPAWMIGPTPARLKAGDAPAVLVLSDIMWRDGMKAAGLGFDFLGRDEHELWATSLIDALLAQHSLV
jgi:hypothetical protein